VFLEFTFVSGICFFRHLRYEFAFPGKTALRGIPPSCINAILSHFVLHCKYLPRCDYDGHLHVEESSVQFSLYRIYSLISRTFFTSNRPVFCLRLIRATYPEGQSFRMSYHRISVIQSNRKCHLAMDESTTIYCTYRRTSFFRRRRFLRFWTIKLTFITFACKNQYFVVNWSRRVFTGEKVNWTAAYSWITLDSRYMAKISAAACLRMRLICEYIQYSFLIPGFPEGRPGPLIGK